VMVGRKKCRICASAEYQLTDHVEQEHRMPFHQYTLIYPDTTTQETQDLDTVGDTPTVYHR
jgi:hypothetical protein